MTIFGHQQAAFFVPPFGRAAIWGGRDVTVCFPEKHDSMEQDLKQGIFKNPEILIYPISSMYGIFTPHLAYFDGKCG